MFLNLGITMSSDTDSCSSDSDSSNFYSGDSDSNSCDSDSSIASLKELQTLASRAKSSAGNSLLHQFVLDNSRPNNSGSKIHTNAKLMSISHTSVNALNDEGYSALHLAVMMNDVLMVKMLLSCLETLEVNIRDSDGMSPLHLSVRKRNLEMIRALLERGSGVNDKNTQGETSLHMAANRSLGVVDILLKNGADVNSRDRRGYTPTIKAVRYERLDIVAYLLKVEDLLVNVKDEKGWGALQWAVYRRNFELVQLLLDKSAVDINETNEDGQNILYLATKKGHFRIFKLLFKRGADAYVKDKSGTSMLRYALNCLGKKV